MVPYKTEGEDQQKMTEEPPVFIVPRKIRLMSSYISRVLRENPHATSIELDITPYYLNIITEYCK